MEEYKRKILVVEDECIVAADIKMTLKKLNYCVTSSVDNGEDAIKKIPIERPDLVLMDITLKGNLNGIETAQIINTQYNIPIIYLSALNDEQTINKALATKPHGYLIKPFAPFELHTAVESALSKMHAY